VNGSFSYCRDPIFLGACGLYVLNRWFLKPLFALPFLRGQFNDLLLIPCALPPLLWLHRKLGLRKDDAMPNTAEIAMHTLVWIFLCEGLSPRYGRGTADYLDAIAYAVGALLAGWSWRKMRSGVAEEADKCGDGAVSASRR
jgi:hypothetical protein